MTAKTLSWPFSLSFTVYLFTWTSDLVGGDEEMSGIPRGLRKSLPISKSKSCSLERNCAHSETSPSSPFTQPHSVHSCGYTGVTRGTPHPGGVREVPLSTGCCFQRHLVLWPHQEDTSAGLFSIARVLKSSCWGVSMQDPEEKSSSQVTPSSSRKLRMAQGQSRGTEDRQGNWVLHISLKQLHFHPSPAAPCRQRGSVGCHPPHLQREVAVPLCCGISPRQLPHSQGSPGEQELDFHHAP